MLRERVANGTCFTFPVEEGTLVAEDLKRRFGELGMKKLSMSDFASWRRGGYEDQKARFSWGVANFLLEPAVQARMQNIEVLGAFSVLDPDRLDPQAKALLNTSGSLIRWMAPPTLSTAFRATRFRLP